MYRIIAMLSILAMFYFGMKLEETGDGMYLLGGLFATFFPCKFIFTAKLDSGT